MIVVFFLVRVIHWIEWLTGRSGKTAQEPAPDASWRSTPGARHGSTGGAAVEKPTDLATSARRGDVPAGSARARKGSKRRSGYTFLREHQQGGLGTVWVVRDERAARDVALKKLRADLRQSPIARRLMRDEALVTAQLQHPNIVPVYDLGTDEAGDFFYTMRLVHGHTLSEQIEALRKSRSSGRLRAGDVRRLVDIFRSVCNAVAYAHSKHVAHLDLKPSNVLVGEFGEVILLDWGCAKRPADLGEGDDRAVSDDAPGRRAGRAGHDDLVLGTPAYMAPEQIQGRHEEISLATDIYQLGAMLYEILTGHPPYRDRSIASSTRGARGEAPKIDWAKEVRRVNPPASPALAAICGQALSADPKNRYRSVDELRHDIEHWMADEPVSVYHSGPLSSSLRWARHHQKVATLIIASVGLLGTFNAQLLRLAMQEQCNKLAHLLAREMKADIGVIEALEGAFETQGDVSRAAFAITANFHLARHDEIAALEWIPAVPHAERAAYEAAVRASAWPSRDAAQTFTFTERSPDSELVEATPRDQYFPVYYVEPYHGNEAAFGYDLSSSAVRLQALHRARAADGPTISQRIDLVQGETGLLAVSPVSFPVDSTTEHPNGYVLGVFRISDLLGVAWEGIDTDHFAVQLCDATDPTALRPLWSNTASRDNACSTIGTGLWGARREVLLWNRTWVVTVRPRLSFLFVYPFSLLAAPPEPV